MSIFVNPYGTQAAEAANAAKKASRRMKHAGWKAYHNEMKVWKSRKKGTLDGHAREFKQMLTLP